ncbi:MAG: hypothetical protein ACYCTV_11045 [Leptospirales bacterium]
MKQKTVPWEILNRETLPARLAQAFDPQSVSTKVRRRIYEFSIVHHLPRLTKAIARIHPSESLSGQFPPRDVMKNAFSLLDASGSRDLNLEIREDGVDSETFTIRRHSCLPF